MSTYRYPFTAFPTGWYRLGRSDEVCFRVPKKVRYFERELALERTSTGVRVTDPRGVVWPSEERHGLVFVWFDPGGTAPTFGVPSFAELDDRSAWRPPFHLGWSIRTHVQEVAENALDLGHFTKVHTYAEVPSLSHFSIDGPFFRVHMHSVRRIFGVRSRTSMDIRYAGMGVVTARVSSDVVDLRVLLTSTPVDQEHIEVHMEVAKNRSRLPLWDRVLGLVLPREIAHEFVRDIPVWESKRYLERPHLCAEEVGVQKIRRWCRQFYREVA